MSNQRCGWTLPLEDGIVLEYNENLSLEMLDRNGVGFRLNAVGLTILKKWLETFEPLDESLPAVKDARKSIRFGTSLTRERIGGDN